MIIKSLHYTRIQDIIKFLPHPSGSVEILTTNWQEVPMHVASGDLNTQSRRAAPGTVYTTSITARIKQSFTIPATAVLLVTLCDDSQIVIGTPDIPVQITTTGDLYLNRLSITHESPHQPLRLAQ